MSVPTVGSGAYECESIHMAYVSKWTQFTSLFKNKEQTERLAVCLRNGDLQGAKAAFEDGASLKQLLRNKNVMAFMLKSEADRGGIVSHVFRIGQSNLGIQEVPTGKIRKWTAELMKVV
ncbi:MAG: hypothetical protein KGJ02_07980 [Verrucomicrobiota bacterium]|nr:hypothetical protein [Verrucomicrobiota bacterium]